MHHNHVFGTKITNDIFHKGKRRTKRIHGAGERGAQGFNNG
jgi:hypothetical protein